MFEVWREVVKGYRENGELKMSSRGSLYPIGYNFIDYSGDTDMFYSVYGYESNDLNAPRVIDHIPIDLDTQDLDVIRSVVSRLPSNYLLYFSGHGYHVVIPNMWGFTQTDIHNKTIANTMAKYFPECDTSIYHHRALFRMPGTCNSKTGLWKNLITPDDNTNAFCKDNWYVHHDLPLITSEDSSWIKEHPPIYSLGKPVQVIKDIQQWMPSPKCIHKLLRKGPIEGQRHATVMRLASHMMHYDGYTQEFTSEALKSWFAEPSRNAEVDRLVRDVKSKYKYGCRDTLLAAQCDARCSFYIGKDYMGNCINLRDTLEQYQEKIKAGQYYDLNHYYDLGHKFIMLDNDLLTIVGAPAVGKSMFLVDLMVRMIKSNPDLYVVWSNLDTSHPLSVRRLVQNVANLTEDEIFNGSTKIAEKIEQAYAMLENRISIVDFANLDEIGKVLGNPTGYGLKNKPSIWIIDDVGSLQTDIDGYAKMQYLGKMLKTLPKMHNVLFVCTDHVPRISIRNGNVDITSSKNAELGERSDVVLALIKNNTALKNGMITKCSDNINILSVKARDGKQFVKPMLFDWERCKFSEVINEEVN